MKKADIINKINLTANKAVLKLKKYSPEILVVSGVIGVVVSAVIACRATTKISTIIEPAKDTIDKIHETIENEEFKNEYSNEDAQKDLAIVYANTGIKIAALYAPAVLLGALSITCIIASNNILHKRNVAIAAAYATIDKGFKEYRDRVAERFGEEVDKELKYNMITKTVDKTVIDENSGKEETNKKDVKVTSLSGYSDYARFFDETSSAWEKDAEYNLMFLKAQEKFANDLLIANGHLFLNDVYKMLGIKESKAGQAVGWIYNIDNPTGDNYVNFHIYDTNKSNENFVNGYERSILLDFNVDGVIWDLI